jgi:hypothetical protein
MKFQITNKFIPFFFILLTNLSIVYSTSVQAVDAETSETKAKQLYIIEVVLFRHLNGQGKTSEYWNDLDLEVNEASINTNYALAEYNLDNKQFSPIAGASRLSDEYYQLSDSANHIRYSKEFKLLAHFGWIQSRLSKQRALPINITSNPYVDSMSPNGSITLYVSRFLHLNVNLTASDCIYPKVEIEKQATNEEQELENNSRTIATSIEPATQEIPAPVTTECVNKTFLFSQNRKMRSKELHYIDNPIFGLLVYVTPFKKGE